MRRDISSCHMPVNNQRAEGGFTLIEMLVGMTMGLLILAGLTAMFVSMNDTSRSVASRSERMGDLYLASHVMQAELRGGQDICWDAANSRIIYQPLDSTVALTGCNAVDAANGSFDLRPVNLADNKPTPYICWDRPSLGGGCQELIRNLDAAGLVMPPAVDGVSTVTLVASYLNENKQSRTLSLRFNTWPRN